MELDFGDVRDDVIRFLQLDAAQTADMDAAFLAGDEYQAPFALDSTDVEIDIGPRVSWMRIVANHKVFMWYKGTIALEDVQIDLLKEGGVFIIRDAQSFIAWETGDIHISLKRFLDYDHYNVTVCGFSDQEMTKCIRINPEWNQAETLRALEEIGATPIQLTVREIQGIQKAHKELESVEGDDRRNLIAITMVHMLNEADIKYRRLRDQREGRQ